MNPSRFFDRDLREDAVSVFGADGAWLLLSIVWYGWRSYYDLAVAAFAGPRPSADHRPADYDEDFQVVLDLHVQSFVFSAAEQLATLVDAARAHQRDRAFFEEYCRNVSVGDRVRAVQGVTVEELVELAGVPAELSDVPDPNEPSAPVLDPAAAETVEVGGLHVPSSAVRRLARERAFDDARAHADGLGVSIGQLAALVVRPPGPADVPRPQSLREVDNSFRHGHRVFFYDAVPEARHFRFLGDFEALERPAVDLYLPRDRDRNIHWGTVGCSPERTKSSLHSLRDVSLCTHLLAMGFLGKQTGRGSALWIGACQSQLPSPADEPD